MDYCAKNNRFDILLVMEEAIKAFTKQFSFRPEVNNAPKLKAKSKYIIIGMGGSHLAAGLLKSSYPILNISVYSDYGLPMLPEHDLRESLIILCSYSGDTEEVLFAAKEAKLRELDVAVISSGGALTEFAKEHYMPHVVIPETGIEPRMAVGFMMLALSRLMQNEMVEEDVRKFGSILDVDASVAEADILAQSVFGKIPVVYASNKNLALAYNWKIKFNETGKTPCFYNVFPELNHNEISSYDVGGFKNGSENIFVILLSDEDDNDRIKVRFSITKDFLKEKNILFYEIKLKGESQISKILNSIVMAEWVALKVASKLNMPDAKTPLISEFKKRLSGSN